MKSIDYNINAGMGKGRSIEVSISCEVNFPYRSVGKTRVMVLRRDFSGDGFFHPNDDDNIFLVRIFSDTDYTALVEKVGKELQNER